MAIEKYFPIYRLAINRTDGPGHAVEFETEEQGREAFAGAREGTFNMRVELWHYPSYDRRELLAEWTRPSIFNLDT